MLSIIFRIIVIFAITIALLMNRKEKPDSDKSVVYSFIIALATLIISSLIEYSVIFIKIDPLGNAYLILSMVISLLDAVITFIGVYMITKILGYRVEKRIPVLTLKIASVFIVFLTYMQVMSVARALMAFESGNFLDSFTAGNSQLPTGWLLIILKNLPAVILAITAIRSVQEQ